MKRAGLSNDASENQYIASLCDNRMQLAPQTQLAHSLILINTLYN